MVEPEPPLSVVARALINIMERASVEHEPHSGCDVAHPINVEMASGKSVSPLSVVSQALINMERASIKANKSPPVDVVVSAPDNARSPSPPTSPCATPHKTYDCQVY